MTTDSDVPIVRFTEPYVTGDEHRYIADVFANGFFQGNGPFTKRVHSHLEKRYGALRVLFTHSCTAALELAALLLNLGPGDEVILPSFTFVTTASAFLRTGARLIFCDVDPDTMNMSVRDALARITDRTRVILPVHYAGHAVDITALQRGLTSRPDIAVVEDAAQGIGASHHGKSLGTLGRLGALSFHETKNIHCGLGGCLFVNDADDVDRAEDIWERGTDRSKFLRGIIDKYSWVELGSSFYGSEFQAAFLLAQLEHLDENLAQRRTQYEWYERELSPLALSGAFQTPPRRAGDVINYHAFFLLLDSEAVCDALRVFLHEHGVQAHTHYVPLHSSPMGIRLGYQPDDLPVTQDASYRLLRLPLHYRLTTSDLARVTRLVREFFQRPTRS
jgi:dTDP-4-amino-4,6-dideoxygalactose transaminase